MSTERRALACIGRSLAAFIRVSALFAGVLIALIAVACRSNTQATTAKEASTQSSAAEQERTVPVTSVVSQAVERTLPLPGELLPLQDVAVHARVQGFLQSIPVDRGSVVKRGGLLARIDAPELKAQLSEADAKVQTAEAQLAEARAAVSAERSTFERIKRASATPGVVAGNDLDVAQQRVEAAGARVEAAAKTSKPSARLPARSAM